ncbi:hypothetical protein SGODD07_02122 [Streptococcus gordonii]|uniref:Uncharacterized protein n=1 Tax=Streptococcus gordonii TaxID=1302 RepID=A0A139MWS2_STRGN|nr:hypothetical protein SGODD07_02122 [Streptococcus gordonii]
MVDRTVALSPYLYPNSENKKQLILFKNLFKLRQRRLVAPKYSLQLTP